MKNKFFLPIFLLFAVNNLQCVAERFTTITAGEFSRLFHINELKKELKLLEGESQRTESQNERIANLKTSIARYDKNIEDKISVLKKEDKLKYARKIKILERLKSDKVDDKLVEEAEKGVSEGDKAFSYFMTIFDLFPFTAGA